MYRSNAQLALLLERRLSAYQMQFQRQLPCWFIPEQTLTSFGILDFDPCIAHFGHIGYHISVEEAEGQPEAKTSSETCRKRSSFFK